jgi:molybdopterin converting factor small subunit
MPIRVLFFGATAAVTGCRKIEMNDAHGVSARELFVRVLNNFPDLSRHKLLMSVNQEFSTGSEVIRAGDEIAIFTAVSGG